MVSQLAFTIIVGIFSGFVAGYTIRFGSYFKGIYKQLGVPKKFLLATEIITAFILMLFFFSLIIMILDNL